VKEQHKFCPNCGNPLEPVAQRPAPAPQAQPQALYQQAQPAYQQMPQEPIKAIIPNLMISKSFGRADTYNLIVTDRRSIFAKLTNEIMNETIKKRRAKADAEGKGFFGKWKAQMASFNTYGDWYADKTPDQALAETQGNWAVDNSAIRDIKVNESSDDEGPTLYYLQFTTITGKFDFKMQYDPRQMLQQAYGSVVR